MGKMAVKQRSFPLSRHHHHHHPDEKLGFVVRVQGTKHHHHHRQVFRLIEGAKIMATANVTVGHVATCEILYLDQMGNPMQVTPTPDSPPTWTKVADDTVDTAIVSADGMQDTITAVGPGQDTIGVTVVVGGQSFAASLQLNVQAAPQVLTSVAIVATVS